MRYEVSALGERNALGIYDSLVGGFVCKRDGRPFATTNAAKAARLAGRLDSARDAPEIAGALIDFGATQTVAWHYAQTVYDLDGTPRPVPLRRDPLPAELMDEPDGVLEMMLAREIPTTERGRELVRDELAARGR